MIYQKGGRILVKADEILGTPAVMGTIRQVSAKCLIVHCDGDAPEWDGPVDHEGNIIHGWPPIGATS